MIDQFVIDAVLSHPTNPAIQEHTSKILKMLSAAPSALQKVQAQSASSQRPKVRNQVEESSCNELGVTYVCSRAKMDPKPCPLRRKKSDVHCTFSNMTFCQNAMVRLHPTLTPAEDRRGLTSQSQSSRSSPLRLAPPQLPYH
eukprot:764891-Hanusia_phi.AAC.3